MVGESRCVGRPLVIVRGGGDLGTGVAHRLYRAGFVVAILELAQPHMVRRTVCFAEAVYTGVTEVEGVEARLMPDFLCLAENIRPDYIPVVIDSDGEAQEAIAQLRPLGIVDARMLKRPVVPMLGRVPITVGLGPSICAGRDVQYVVETQRGLQLGKVIDAGEAIPDTGIPGMQGGESTRRLLRAPHAGVFKAVSRIGDIVNEGDTVGYVDNDAVRVSLSGILRGLVHEGVCVAAGEKIGDCDPRGRSINVHLMSDKARAVAGGVLEAVMRGGAFSYAFATNTD